jgi:hypothetical protein
VFQVGTIRGNILPDSEFELRPDSKNEKLVRRQKSKTWVSFTSHLQLSDENFSSIKLTQHCFGTAGIPKFFRWLSERYPLINQSVALNGFMPGFDNLYLDMNGACKIRL